MTRPTYDARITLGNVLTLVSLAVAAFVGWGNFSSERALNAQRMTLIEKRLDMRDADHDRIVQIEADVKFIRSAVEKRAEAR